MSSVQKKRLSTRLKIFITILLILTVLSVSLASTVFIIAEKENRSSNSVFYEGLLNVALCTKTDEQAIFKELENQKIKNKDYHVPKIYSTLYGFTLDTFQGTEVCVFNKEAKNTVMYLHGGAFIYQPLIFHFDFCRRLSETLNVKVVMPVYPKAPNYTYETIIPYCYDFYLSLLEDTAAENIVFMGDSAGASLIMSLSQYIYDNDTVQPKDIFAFSPCLDITLSNEDIAAYAPLDPMLNVFSLQIKMRTYVGEGNSDNPYISPYYCDFAVLPTMTIFVGGHEIFLPDCKKLNEELSTKDISVNYYEFPYMNHVFAIFPMEESTQCIQIVKNIWGV